jgi:hypothetical protein
MQCKFREILFDRAELEIMKEGRLASRDIWRILAARVSCEHRRLG